ncbi:MAG: hypothetical protein LWW85_04360 [Marinilabiliales bacterium]|nr:hypothetical protein [Marinilabiliales bacterium]
MNTLRNLISKFTAKNLLFLFVLVFVSTEFQSLTFGQTIPRLPTCPDSPLKPMAGKNYTYAVTVPSPYTTPQSFDWFVTDDPGFIAGSLLLTTHILPNDKEFIDAGSGYHNPSDGTNSITIRWTGKSAQNARTKPYFLVIQYKGTNGTTCEAMNLRAYKIEPFNAFTLDLTNMQSGTDLGLNGSNGAVEAHLCAKDLVSASYDGTKMVYDYGTNELIFKVVAANFSGGWKPSVKVSGLAGSQSIGEVEWSTTTTFSGSNPFTRSGDIWTAQNKIPAPADNITEDGEVVYVRVTLQNHDYEGTTDTAITLALNGVTDDGDEDVHYADCKPDGYSNDVATQIILARPVLTSNTGTPAQSFLP